MPDIANSCDIAAAVGSLYHDINYHFGHYEDNTYSVLDITYCVLLLQLGRSFPAGHRLKAGPFASLSFFGNFESLVWLTRIILSTDMTEERLSALSRFKSVADEDKYPVICCPSVDEV